MNFNGTRQLNAPRPEVWRLLNDLETLRQCIPGCETLARVDDSTCEAVVVANVGPVRARFQGKLRRSDVVEPTSFCLEGQGQGGIAGFGKMRAWVELEESGAGTLLKFTSDASVGGKLAQVGSRLVAVAAEKFNAEFFDRLEALITAGHSARHAPPEVPTAEINEPETVAVTERPRGFRAWLISLAGRRSSTLGERPSHLALERVVAEAEIRTLLNRYCHLIDKQSFDSLGELFTPDGELDLTGTPVCGPSGIASFMRGRAKALTLHVPAGYIISFDNAHEARVYGSVLVFRGGADGAAPPFVSTAPGAAATYSDCVQLVGGRWRIRSRKAQLFMVAASV